MLYLIATPIGNLGDLTHRAVETLHLCDYILCEDTRHSGILLKHYGIHKPLKSFHQFNEKQREDEVIADLRAGKKMGLITDAGTPGICDPGEAIVKRCREEKLPVTALPGPCAWVTALSLSRMSKERVQFVGFLPKKETDMNRLFSQLLHYTGTTVCYESPHRLQETLALIKEKEPKRHLCVMRELTKTFEECVEGSAEEVWNHFQKNEPRGEIVLLIEGRLDESTVTSAEWVELLQSKYHLSLSEAVKVTAEIQGLSKRELYQAFLRK